MENDATKTILPSKEALNEFLKAHKYKSFPTAVEATRNGKKLVGSLRRPQLLLLQGR